MTRSHHFSSMGAFASLLLGALYSRALAAVYLLFHFTGTTDNVDDKQKQKIRSDEAAGGNEAKVTTAGGSRRRKAAMSRSISKHELAAHNTRHDAWIAVRGLVYDITPHIVNHPGWRTAGQVSTVMAIMVCIKIARHSSQCPLHDNNPLPPASPIHPFRTCWDRIAPKSSRTY